MSFIPEPYIRHAHYYETDKMGVIHHSNYIRWFEEARLDYMKRAGLNYEEMENDGILMPVTQVHCKYKISIRFDDEVKIHTKPVLFNGMRVAFSYEIYTADGENIVAIGESGHCFIDECTKMPLNLKKRCPDLFKKVLCLFSEQQDTNDKE